MRMKDMAVGMLVVCRGEIVRVEELNVNVPNWSRPLVRVRGRSKFGVFDRFEFPKDIHRKAPAPREYPGGSVGGVPRFNPDNVAYVEQSNALASSSDEG